MSDENLSGAQVPPPPMPLPPTGELPVVSKPSTDVVSPASPAVNDETPKSDTKKTDIGSDEKITRKDIRKEHKKSVVGTFFKDAFFVIVIAAVLSIVIKSFLFQPFIIPSESMRDTLKVDDRIMTYRLKPSIFKIKHGDVVVFKDTKNWLPQSVIEKDKKEKEDESTKNPAYNIFKFFGVLPEDDSSYLVKRAIGLPGDHVTCRGLGYPILINGKEISEPYLKPGVKPSELAFDVTVPADSLFVMGDNRSNSADSRYNRLKPGEGFVSQKDVVGVAFVTYWPQDRFKILDNEESVFKEVPSP